MTSRTFQVITLCDCVHVRFHLSLIWSIHIIFPTVNMYLLQISLNSKTYSLLDFIESEECSFIVNFAFHASTYSSCLSIQSEWFLRRHMFIGGTCVLQLDWIKTGGTHVSRPNWKHWKSHPALDPFPLVYPASSGALGRVGSLLFVLLLLSIFRPIVALVVSPPLLLTFAVLQMTIWGSFQLLSSYDTILLFSSLFRIICGPGLGLGWSSALAYLLSDLGISLILGLRVQRAYLLFWFNMGILTRNETKTLGLWNVLKLWGYGLVQILLRR